MYSRPLLRHVALHVEDPEATARFYTRMLGLPVVARTNNPLAGDMVFLSGNREEEDHELVFISRRAAQHVAFRVDSLADLKGWYQAARRKGIPIVLTANHGLSVSFYVKDPAENLVEVYWATGRLDSEPGFEPIDLELPDEEILARVAAIPSAV